MPYCPFLLPNHTWTISLSRYISSLSQKTLFQMQFQVAATQRSRLVENPCVELAFCIELSPAKMHLVLLPIRLTMERFAMKKVAFLTLWGLFGIHIPFCPYRGVCCRDKSLAFEDSTRELSLFPYLVSAVVSHQFSRTSIIDV